MKFFTRKPLIFKHFPEGGRRGTKTPLTLVPQTSKPQTRKKKVHTYYKQISNSALCFLVDAQTIFEPESVMHD